MIRLMLPCLVLAIAVVVAATSERTATWRARDAEAELARIHGQLSVYCGAFETFVRADDRPGLRAELGNAWVARLKLCADGYAPQPVERFESIAVSLRSLNDPPAFERAIDTLSYLWLDAMQLRRTAP